MPGWHPEKKIRENLSTWCVNKPVIQPKKPAGKLLLSTVLPAQAVPVISTLTGVNKVIVVTEPTRSGFHDLKRIVDLTKEFNIPTYIVVNKYDLNEI